MKAKRTITLYYKRRLYGGRSRLARAVDFIALRAILLFAFYFWFTTLMDNTFAAWFLSVTALTVISIGAELYKSMRLDSFIIRERRRMRGELIKKKLLMMPPDEYDALVKRIVKAAPERFHSDCLIYTLQKAAEASADDVLAAYRAARARGCSRALIFSVSGKSDAASALMREHRDIRIGFAPEELFLCVMDECGGHMDAEIDALILDSVEAERASRKAAVSEPFRAVRTRRYILIALGLFIASFFVKYALYYRLLSAACLCFSAMAKLVGGAPESGESKAR